MKSELTVLHVHKLIACKRSAAHHALVALEQDYNNPGLHDNLSAGYSGCEVDFKKKNHHKLISYYYDFIKTHPDSLIALAVYQQSFEMQKAPRRIDSLISMVQIYEIQQNHPQALEITNLILSVYKNDYTICDGEEIKPYILDKERLEKLI